MKKLVTPAMVVNAAARDVASGRPDAEELVMAFFKSKSKALPLPKRWAMRLGLWMVGANEYRSGIRALHRALGTTSVEIEVKEE